MLMTDSESATLKGILDDIECIAVTAVNHLSRQDFMLDLMVWIEDKTGKI